MLMRLYTYNTDFLENGFKIIIKETFFDYINYALYRNVVWIYGIS